MVAWVPDLAAELSLLCRVHTLFVRPSDTEKPAGCELSHNNNSSGKQRWSDSSHGTVQYSTVLMYCAGNRGQEVIKVSLIDNYIKQNCDRPRGPRCRQWWSSLGLTNEKVVCGGQSHVMYGDIQHGITRGRPQSFLQSTSAIILEKKNIWMVFSLQSLFISDLALHCPDLTALNGSLHVPYCQVSIIRDWGNTTICEDCLVTIFTLSCIINTIITLPAGQAGCRGYLSYPGQETQLIYSPHTIIQRWQTDENIVLIKLWMWNAINMRPAHDGSGRVELFVTVPPNWLNLVF